MLHLDHLESRLVLSQDLMFAAASATVGDLGDRGALIAGLDAITINATVRNRGDSNSSGADLKVLLTRDFEVPESDSRDVSIGKLRVPDIDDRNEWAVTRDFVVTEGMQSGDYYVFVKLKPDDNAIDNILGGSNGDNANNNLAFTGLRISVQGAAAPSDPGTLTGGIRVKLAGKGAVGLVRRDDGFFDIEAEGTNTGSRIVIENADGFNRLGDIRVNGSLNIFQSKVALTGNLTISGDLKELKLRYVVGSTITINGAGRELKMKADNLDGASLICAEPIRTLDTGAGRAGATRGVIQAPSCREMRIAGALYPDVNLTTAGTKPILEKAKIDDAIFSNAFVVHGSVKSLKANGIEGGAITVLGELRELDIRDNARGMVSALSFHTVKFARDVTGLSFLAGAFLGNDARIGGEGDAGDIFGAGTIHEFKAGRTLDSSVIAAGVNPVNGILGDDDDIFVAAPGSRIDVITVKNAMIVSKFVSPVVPAKASIDGQKIMTAGDPRFVTVMS